MIEKNLRLTLDFWVTINEITAERVRSHYLSNAQKLSQWWVWRNAVRQRRLLRALLRDEEALRQYLIYVVVDEVEPQLDSRIEQVFMIGDASHEQILATVFPRLPARDAAFFRELLEARLFWENTGLIIESFVVEWTRATLVESNLFAEGNVGSLE